MVGSNALRVDHNFGFIDHHPSGVSELKRISETLQSEVDCVSSLLVRLLHVKDKRASRASRQSDRLSAILKDYASKNGKLLRKSSKTTPARMVSSYE